jgi:hypothetical protein
MNTDRVEVRFLCLLVPLCGQKELSGIGAEPGSDSRQLDHEKAQKCTKKYRGVLTRDHTDERGLVRKFVFVSSRAFLRPKKDRVRVQDYKPRQDCHEETQEFTKKYPKGFT